MTGLTGLRDWAASLGESVVEFALPQRCPGCGVPAGASDVLCAPCRARIPALHEPLCARCLVQGREPVLCRRHRGFEVFAAWVYDERAAAVVHALKYGERPALAQPLGATLAAAVPHGRRVDLVLEVPLHPARLRERGYNQAAVLADGLADTLGAPRLADALARTKPTPPQARLGPEARRRNLAGAFRAVRPQRLQGRRVLLVDDVMTTGATLEACLETLRDSGADAAGVALAWAQ